MDGQTLTRYRAETSAAGEMLRRGLVQDGEGAHFALCADGRCPHLQQNGLCEIIATLGEGYLCDICREHPRFYNLQGVRMECGLGASCEEAARLILETADYRTLCLVEELDIETEEWEITPHEVRDELLALLANHRLSYAERLWSIGEKCGVSLPVWGDIQATVGALEYLDEAHRQLLTGLAEPPAVTGERASLCERFLAYLLYRHTGGAQTRDEFCEAVGFALATERLFCALLCGGMSPVKAAVLLSEEIEYSEDNTAAVRDAVARSGQI